MSDIICRLLASAGARVVRFREPTSAVGNEDDAQCKAHHRHGDWWLTDVLARIELAACADVILVRDVDMIEDSASLAAVVLVIDEGDFVDRRLPVRSHELVAQAATGAVFEHIPDRPAYNGLQFGTYGAAINAATGIVASLTERIDTGVGQRLTVSLCRGVVSYMGIVWSDFSHSEETPSVPIPVGADVPLFRCADGERICLSSSPRCPNPLEVLVRLLELHVSPDALRGTRSPDDLINYYYNYGLLSQGFQKFSSVEIVNRLRNADFAVEIVKPPGHAWDAPDVIGSGVFETCAACNAQYVGFPIEGA